MREPHHSPSCRHRRSVGACLLVLLITLGGGCGDGGTDAVGGSCAPGPKAEAWLTDITDASGLDFVHESGAKGELWLPEIMGPGVAIFDCNGDGDLDLYFPNGNDQLPEAARASMPVSRLYLQQDGRFRDATESSGLGDEGYGMGVAIGDIDNDGDLDLYATNFGPDRLYRNRGDGVFEDVTTAAGIDVKGWSCSAAFLDHDRDGDLDLFVTQYVHFDPRQRCTDETGHPDYCSPANYAPARDVLLRNNGDGTFTDISVQAGMGSTYGAGLGVVSEDFNEDGWADIYVANDGDPNNLWLNQGDGTFIDVAVVWGAAYNQHAAAEAGMGVIAEDLDNDATPDLFVTHLTNESNTLYASDGPGQGFRDTTGRRGLAGSSLPLTGFGTAALDGDLDGDLDLFVVNGAVKRQLAARPTSLPKPWNAYAQPNLAYRNDASGRFVPLGEPAAAFVIPVEITRGLATGDIDGDGDLDVVISNTQGFARIYRNDAPRNGHWIVVRCLDPDLRRAAIGARLVVTAGKLAQTRTIRRAFGYLSSSQPVAHLGLGQAERVDRIDVRWPDGSHERFGPFEADQIIELVRGQGASLP